VKTAELDCRSNCDTSGDDATSSKNKNMAVSMQEDVIDSLTVSSSDASNRQDLASCRTQHYGTCDGESGVHGASSSDINSDNKLVELSRAWKYVQVQQHPVDPNASHNARF
jgi:hypothetical protein